MYTCPGGAEYCPTVQFIGQNLGIIVIVIQVIMVLLSINNQLKPAILLGMLTLPILSIFYLEYDIHGDLGMINFVKTFVSCIVIPIATVILKNLRNEPKFIIGMILIWMFPTYLTYIIALADWYAGNTVNWEELKLQIVFTNMMIGPIITPIKIAVSLVFGMFYMLNKR